MVLLISMKRYSLFIFLRPIKHNERINAFPFWAALCICIYPQYMIFLSVQLGINPSVSTCCRIVIPQGLPKIKEFSKMMIPSNLIDKIERRKILRRLNTKNVFDFEYTPNENDQLELNFQEDDGFKFTFRKGKWVLEEWFGEHPLFEHKDKRKGVIDSKNSRLKEVYKQYLEVLHENERDIVDCGWSNYRMSEKSLIDFMERRIRGENMMFPDDYFPLGI